MFVDIGKFVEVRLSVRVCVEPKNETLLETIRESGGALSVVDVVSGEIQSNLESVSYVRHADVEEERGSR